MSFTDGLIQELQHETTSTRQHLERIPTDKLTWKPHEKSMTFAQLGSHIAEMTGWFRVTLHEPSYDIPAEYKPWHGMSTKEIVDKYDAAIADALDALKGVPDQNLFITWKLAMAGSTIFELPRIVAVRSFLMNHIVHHRAQLGVYLRLNDIAVPSSYGPSFDEGQMNNG